VSQPHRIGKTLHERSLEVSPLSKQLIEDMACSKLTRKTQSAHISSCKRFADWLKRSTDIQDDDRRGAGFPMHLIGAERSI